MCMLTFFLAATWSSKNTWADEYLSPDFVEKIFLIAMHVDEVSARNSNAWKTIVDALSCDQGPPADIPFLVTIFFKLHNIASASEKEELVHWCKEGTVNIPPMQS